MKNINRLIDFIFYRSLRVGKNGELFYLWKLRTMEIGADKRGTYSVAEDDARITRIGRILRRTHLDEIPNIINVIRGEMALFGPRPDIPYYVCKLMPPGIRCVVTSVKPGCIDIATLWNINEGKKLKGRKDPDRYYRYQIWPEKLRLQCQSILKTSI